MLNHRTSLVVGPFLAALLLLFPMQGWSAEGIEVKVVAEYPVNIPGIEKILLRKVNFQPGASVDLTVEHVEFCSATQGIWSVVDHTNGTTTIYTAGSRWAPEKGAKVTVSNPGDEPAEQWVYRLIEKK
ncbi:MAG: hypothetical protein ACE5KF_00175 [Kiloniellaceae bacterium]